MSYFQFFFKNYLRSHRYLREIILIFIFHIFFWGFLYTDKPDDVVWTVFGVLALLLNMVTVPSLFYLEKGNSLYFTLIRPMGRIRFFIAKLLCILAIDFFWILIFTLIYGLRFMDPQYFYALPLRLTLITLLMILSVLMLSLFFSFRTGAVWILMLLIVFGGITDKGALLPVESIAQAYKLLAVLLPPFLEIIYSAVMLNLSSWRWLFLGVGVLQIGFYFYLNYFFIRRKDFI